MKKRLPEFLTLLMMALPAFLATEAHAGEITITRPARSLFEVGGGSGDKGWHIRYGTSPFTPRPNVLPNILTLSGPGTTAYFSHYGWLRRIDTEKGVVTGRWHFPGFIKGMTANGNLIQVVVEEQLPRNQSFTRIIDFNPDDPHIPYWPTTSLFIANTPEIEINCFCRPREIQAGQASVFLSEAENAVRRDTLSPWLRVALAHVYQALGKPEATQLLDDSARAGPADFNELFRISWVLDSEGRREAAREAFERGYENYWQSGNDPRFLTLLLARLVSYTIPQTIPDDLRPVMIERSYTLAPWVESADYAWNLYARQLRQNGNPKDAEIWAARAEEARSNSLFPMNVSIRTWFAFIIVLVPAVLVAAILYLAVLFVRYLPERRMQLRAAAQTGIGRRLTFFNVEYWSRKDRTNFLMIVLFGWIALGVMTEFVGLIFRTATMPLSIGMGTFAGPATISNLESLPESNERNLLVAIAYQQDRQPEKAEALYRQIPQFPESWNNLGALLKDSGKTDEARQAFERALQLDPQMAEPRVNLGNPPSDLWTGFHQRYLPDHGMLAPPRRERVLRAFGFGSAWQVGLQGLLGPFAAVRGFEAFPLFIQPPRFIVAVIALLIIVLIGAAIFSVVRPVRDVTQTPPRYQPILELLFPGTAAEWRYLGGIVLTVWAFALFQAMLPTARGGFPFFSGMPSIRRAFGVPVADSVANPQFPSGSLLAIVVLLYAANAALIWYSRRRPSSI